MSERSVGWKEFLTTYGYYGVDFTLTPRERPSLAELRDWMMSDGPKYTGWSPFWWPTRAEIAPQVVDQATYECLHDGIGWTGHIERWRASTTGAFTIIRAYDSDVRRSDSPSIVPGKYLELTLPVWRVAELLLYAGRMAVRYQSLSVDFIVRYEGLAGRLLTSRASPNRILVRDYTTKAQRYEKRMSLDSGDIELGVAEMTDRLVRGLFELFQFTLPATLCEEEITKMRAHRF